MNKMFAIFLTLLLGLAFGFKLFGISIFKGKLSGLPNGNKWYIPLLGETLAYIKSHKSNSLGSFLQEHCSRYGKVFRSHLFGSPTIVSCDLEFNTFVLQNEEELFQTSYPKPIRDILGHSSVLFASGYTHKKLRSVAISFIQASKSRPDFICHVEKLSLSFIDSWKAKKKVFFHEEAKQLNFYLTLKSVLSMESEDPVAAKILEDFHIFIKGFTSLPLPIPGTAYSKGIKARERILSILKDIIKQSENMMSTARGDFLDEILADVELNEKQKVSIVLDITFGGYESTSSLIALVVYFLAQDPSSLQKLQEEHQLLRKSKKDGDPLNWEDYKNMNFTSHVISEALRCGNYPFLFRKAIKDVKFKEYTIPAGWKVLLIVSGPHLDPSLHDYPMKFNPQRWQDNPTISRKVAPFGGGLRICPGSELAKCTTACFLHHFVLNLRWKMKEDESAPMTCPPLDFKEGLELEIEQIH